MNRKNSMLGHLIGQFTDKPVISAILEALAEELDGLDTAMDDLKHKRWIDTGDGVQLDGIGEIVGQSRRMANALQMPFFGFFGQPNTTGFEQARFYDVGEQYLATATLADPEYRRVLWQKVFKNTTDGTAEDTINSLKFIFKAPVVYVEDVGNAKIAVSIGRELSANDVALADAVDLMIRGGGVGLEYRGYFDYDAFFGFLGQPNAKGFEQGKMADVF